MSVALSRFDLVLIFGYGVGVFLILTALRLDIKQLRVGRVGIAPVLTGIAMIVALLVLYLTETIDVWSRITESPLSIVITLAGLFLGVAVTETLLSPIVRICMWIIHLIRRKITGSFTQWEWLTDIFRFIMLTGLVIAVIGATRLLQNDVVADVGANTIANYPIPGAPTALVMRGERDGYLVLGEGEIYKFELPADPLAELELELVAEDLTYPHGAAIIGDRLYVTHQGVFECRDLGARGSFAGIRCAKLPDLSTRESQIQFLNDTRGEVLAFDIQPDGSLDNKQVILADLPVANGDHAVNAIVAGPDGRLYVTLGGLDILADEPDLEAILNSIERPNFDLIGTVISFNTDGSDLQVFSSGIRNVYDLAFDDEGRLYGVDNDGPTSRGWRMEEVLNFKKGADYGHPFEGTFDPRKNRTDDPVWVIDINGSAGIEWAGNVGLEPGLLVGGVNQLVYVEFDVNEHAEDVFSDTQVGVTQLVEISGFVTVAEALANDQLIIAVFGFRPGTHSLSILELGE